MHNEELFDQKIERFLKKQMTPEEESSFKEEDIAYNRCSACSTSSELKSKEIVS